MSIETSQVVLDMDVTWITSLNFMLSCYNLRVVLGFYSSNPSSQQYDVASMIEETLQSLDYSMAFIEWNRTLQEEGNQSDFFYYNVYVASLLHDIDDHLLNFTNLQKE